MADPASCPVCGSADMYCLLNTFHCKRCGNLWKAEKKRRIRTRAAMPDHPDPRQVGKKQKSRSRG